jgi:hypothetical protein
MWLLTSLPPAVFLVFVWPLGAAYLLLFLFLLYRPPCFCFFAGPWGPRICFVFGFVLGGFLEGGVWGLGAVFDFSFCFWF